MRMKFRNGLGLAGGVLAATLAVQAETVDLAEITGESLTVTSLSSSTDYTNSGSTTKTLRLAPTANVTYAGSISGNLKVEYAASGITTTLSGANTFTEGLDIRVGTVKTVQEGTLGTGKIVFADANAYLRIAADMTIANAISLGDYSKANYTAGLRLEGNYTVKLTGPVSYRYSWIASNNGHLILSGGVSWGTTSSTLGSFLCQANGGAISVVDTPLTFSSANQYLTLIGASYTSLDVPGNRVPYLQFKEQGGLRLGVDGALSNQPWLDFPYDNRGLTRNGGRLDLNGHDADFGHIKIAAGESQNAFTIANTSETPATFSFNQTNANVSIGFIRTSGPVSFVKKGDKSFAITNADFTVARTLDVAAGTLALAPVEGGRIAETVIVRSGATLDLGGKTATCETCVVLTGATVKGTLTANRRGYCAAAGKTENFVVDPDLAVYYPFRSAATLAKDFSCQGNADLVIGGNPQFVAEGRFGGSIYFDGASYLTNNVGVYPASLPTGRQDNTLLVHAKGAGGTVSSQAMITLGKNITGNNNVMQAVDATHLRHFTWSDSDDFKALLPNGGTFASGWHSLGTSMAWNSDEGKAYHALWAEGTCLTNGLLVNKSGASMTPNVAAETFTIAGHMNYQNSFKGWMDEVAVMKRVLTAAEMQTYHTGGVAALVRAENVDLLSAADATLNVAAGVTSAWVEGPGAISTFGLTATGVITNAPSLSGDLTVADGARIVTDLLHPICVDSPAKLTGAGTVQVVGVDVSTLSLPMTRTILRATKLEASQVAAWTVVGHPQAVSAKLVVSDTELNIRLSRSGVVVIFR